MNAAQAIARQTLRNTGRHVLVVAALAVVVLLSMASGDKVSADRPAAEGSAHALVDAHQCSNHISDPTHVVVTTEAGVTRYAGKHLTDKAVEQEVFGVDHNLTVHAFCA